MKKLTEEEYAERVKDAAATLLTETEAAKWKEENPDDDFHDFANGIDLYDHLHSIIDSTCEHNWQGAVSVLQLTGQNPDHVDSGLYEGCSWQQILVTIAYEVYSWDVQEEVERMFENDEFEEYLMPIETTPRQIGHFPDIQGYKIPKGWWAILLAGTGVKILVQKPKAGFELSVVFEGAVTDRPHNYIVYAKRVYTQGGSNANIQDDLQRCKDEFGVKLFPQGEAAEQ